jgi:hypothetical protein
MGGGKSRVRYNAPGKRKDSELRGAIEDFRRVRDQPVLPPTRERIYREPISQHAALVDAQNAIRDDRQQRLAAARQRVMGLLPGGGYDGDYDGDYDERRSRRPVRARSGDAQWRGDPSTTTKRRFQQDASQQGAHQQGLAQWLADQRAMDEDDGYDGRAPSKRGRAMPYADLGGPGEGHGWR